MCVIQGMLVVRHRPWFNGRDLDPCMWAAYVAQQPPPTSQNSDEAVKAAWKVMEASQSDSTSMRVYPHYQRASGISCESTDLAYITSRSLSLTEPRLAAEDRGSPWRSQTLLISNRAAGYLLLCAVKSRIFVLQWWLPPWSLIARLTHVAEIVGIIPQKPITLYQMSQLLLFTLHDVILSVDHLVTLSELALKTRLPPWSSWCTIASYTLLSRNLPRSLTSDAVREWMPWLQRQLPRFQYLWGRFVPCSRARSQACQCKIYPRWCSKACRYRFAPHTLLLWICLLPALGTRYDGLARIYKWCGWPSEAWRMVWNARFVVGMVFSPSAYQRYLALAERSSRACRHCRVGSRLRS